MKKFIEGVKNALNGVNTALEGSRVALQGAKETSDSEDSEVQEGLGV